MVLIGNSDDGAYQDQAGKGHLQTHLPGRCALHEERGFLSQSRINRLMQALAHEHGRLQGIALILNLAKAGFARGTFAQMTQCIRGQIRAFPGFGQIRNFK